MSLLFDFDLDDAQAALDAAQRADILRRYRQARAAITFTIPADAIIAAAERDTEEAPMVRAKVLG